MPTDKPKSADAFRTISEVAERLNVPQHVLRFWETKFTQVKPLKRAGGRRYYRPDDIELLERLRDLLYSEGYTIRGVQKLLREKGVKSLTSSRDPVSAPSDVKPPPSVATQSEANAQAVLFPDNGNERALSEPSRAALSELLVELKEIRAAF